MIKESPTMIKEQPTMLELTLIEDNETPVSKLLTQWRSIIASNKKKTTKSQYRDYNRGLKYLRIYKRHPTCALYKRAIFYLLRSGLGTLDMQTYNADYEGEEYVILTTRTKNMGQNYYTRSKSSTNRR